LDSIRRDLVGVTRILTSRTLCTRPIDWAREFASNPHLGEFTIDLKSDCPPPQTCPIPPAVLDEVTRCLIERARPQTVPLSKTVRVALSGDHGQLVIEVSGGAVESGSGTRAVLLAPNMRLRRELMELILSRLDGAIELHEGEQMISTRLTIGRPKTAHR
jgi:hypothetical protein